MARSYPLRALLLLGLALSAVACGDDDGVKRAPSLDGGLGPIAVPNLDGGAPDASTIAPLSACVERQSALSRPPIGALPCELLPPGLTLGR